MAGLALARVDAISFEAMGLLLLLSGLLLLLRQSFRPLLLAALFGMAWGTASLFWDGYRVSVDESWLTDRQQISAQIEKVDERAFYTRLRLVHVRRGSAELPGKAELYLYGKERTETLLAGEKIQLSAKFHLPRNKLNPGAFDYRGYCFDRHIALIGSGKDVVVVDRHPSLLENVRQRIIANLPDGDAAGIIRALLLAERTYIPYVVQDNFAASGAAHLLAISGLHVGMVAGWCFLLIWWLLTRREAWIVNLPVRNIALTAGLLAATLYATVAGWPITAQRSVVMLAAAAVAWWLASRFDPLNIMLAALLLLLLIDPAAVISVSLWLSFAAVTALLLWLQNVGDAQTHRRFRIRSWLVALMWTTIVASLATLPIIVDVFGRIPTYALPANLLLVPLYTLFILPLSIVGELASVFAADSMAIWMFEQAATAIDFGNLLLAEIKSWPGGNLWATSIPLSVSLLYGLAIIVATHLWLRKRLFATALCMATALALYLSVAMTESYPQVPTFTVWDVGQGASSTLVMPGGEVLIIDLPGRAGSRFNGGTDVAAGLREQGITHADLLVLSHAQSDHAGGAERLLEHLNGVREVWLADVPANRDYPPMNRVIARVVEGGGVVRWLKQGDEMTFGDASLQVLWPPQGFTPANNNNSSLVLSLRISSGERLLFPADVERASERAMVEAVRLKGGSMHHDITLMPHHGSRTSSSNEWIDAVAPDIAIVQTGWANRYHFPYVDVVERYQRVGAKLYDTKHGAVTVHFDPSLEQGVAVEQFQAENRGKRDTALQCWQRAL